MYMDYNEAVRYKMTAEAVIKAHLKNFAEMGELLAGNLRVSNIKHSVLMELKKELGEYDGKSFRWKDL